MTPKQYFLILFFPFLFFLSNNVAQAQTSLYSRYIVQFTDKNNSPFSVNNPSTYLSARAIERRQRFNIPVTENDLPINPSYIQQVLATGVQLLNRSKWLNSISIQTSDSLALDTIAALSFVSSVNSIAAFKSGNSDVNKESADLVEENLNDFAGEYGASFNQIDMINGEWLHNAGYRGEGMIIAQLDAGFPNVPQLSVFSDLISEGRILGTHDFVIPGDSVFGYSSHGAEVLSTMASNLQGSLVGTAPKASYYLFRTEDEASEYPIEEHNWAAAAEWADSVGADIITSSLGYSEFDDSTFNHTYADLDGNTTMVTRAADFAASKGMIVCNSAGNSGNGPWHYIIAPADGDSVLAVGAVGPDQLSVSFSSRGPSSDGRVKPNVVAQGYLAALVDPATGYIFSGNGTSFSNPIVAGMTACLWQAHPDKSNMEIIQAVEESASLYANPNDSMGYGIPNFYLAHLILSDEAPANLSENPVLVYPNPFENSTGLIYYSALSQTVTLEFFDAVGREIFLGTHDLNSGFNYVPVTVLQNFPEGNYFIRFQTDYESTTIRLMKVKE